MKQPNYNIGDKVWYIEKRPFGYKLVEGTIRSVTSGILGYFYYQTGGVGSKKYGESYLFRTKQDFINSL